MIRLLAVVFVLVLALLNWQFGRDMVAAALEKAPVPDYSERLPAVLDVILTETLMVARGGTARSGLWMTCSDEQRLRLVLNTRIPIEETYVRNDTYRGVRINLSVHPNTRSWPPVKNAPRLIMEKGTWHRDDTSDLVLSPPLSIEDVQSLVRGFAVNEPTSVRVMLSETGVTVPTIVDWRAISVFAAKCIGSRRL